MNILIASVGALGLGFLVGLVTEFLIGREKSHRYPGGSLAAGASTGIALGTGFLPILLTALLGIVGWVIYLLLFPVEK